MKVTSRITLVTGSQLEPVHHEPGTPVDLPKNEAEDLIARGLAAPFQAPKESAGPVNLNEADIGTLVKIKGIGKATATDIIASREADGPFASLEDAAERVGGVSIEQLQASDVTV